MRFNSVGFALSVGMAMIVVLLGFTLLSAGGLIGFAADDAEAARRSIDPPALPLARANAPAPAPSGPKAAEVVAGEALFAGSCAQCHAVSEQVVGPALGGITRRRSLSWILPWVKNSGKVVASGDEYAVALFTKFNKQQMPSFSLSDKEITSIVAYITSQESPAGAVAAR